MSILYCTPAGWTPGGKGFAKAACAADSEYTVLVPSEAWSGLLSGRGTTCPYPQPPAGLAKDHIRVALTAQGVRYAVLAQVGTLEATPAFRLSSAGLHERLSSTVVAGGPGLRPDWEPWMAVSVFLNPGDPTLGGPGSDTHYWATQLARGGAPPACGHRYSAHRRSSRAPS